MNRQSSEPAELPPYQALLAVDMKDFSGHPGRDHEALTERIPEILGSAFRRAGLSHVWAEQTFHRMDGDGYTAGFRSAVLPFLLNPLLAALQAELEHVNGDILVGSGRPIRMRLSINVGPVTNRGGNTISAGSGAERVVTHRLLDASAVKDVLTRSADATCVAAIVSARAFEDAVLAGYTGESADLYARVSVKVKTYEGVAYLRVPKPSGDALDRGLVSGGPDEPGDADSTVPQRGDEGVPSVSTSIGTAYGPVNSGTGDQIYNPWPERRRGRRGDR